MEIMKEFKGSFLSVLHGESLSPFPDELPDGLDLVIHHLLGEARIGSQKEGLIHDGISTGEWRCGTIRRS